MKRRLFKFALFLLLGIIFNVLNSWRLINSFDYERTTSDHDKHIFFFPLIESRISKTFLNTIVDHQNLYLEVNTDGWGDAVSITNMKLHKFTLEEPWSFLIGTFPDYYLIIAKIERPGIAQQIIRYGKSDGNSFMPGWSGGLSLEKTSVGWPMTSLSTGYWDDDEIGNNSMARAWEKRRAWVIPNSMNKLFSSANQLILPYGVLWTGFAINTIFYAVILWMLWLSPFTVWRFIRRKRGRCIKCGYDLRKTSGGCPECGWGRETEG